MVYIGQQLRFVREKLNLKQEHVAKKLGISQTTLSRMESNQRNLSEEEIQQFAKLFGTTFEELKAFVVDNVGSNKSPKTKSTLTSEINEINQKMEHVIRELRANQEVLREENNQLRQRDEKWMQIFIDMQSQLTGFLSNNKG